MNDTMTGTSNTCPMCGQPAIEEAPKSTEDKFGEWVEANLNRSAIHADPQATEETYGHADKPHGYTGGTYDHL